VKPQKKQSLLLCYPLIWASCFIASFHPVAASMVPSLELPELVQRADAICVGTPTTIGTSGQMVFDTGVFAQDGTPIKLREVKSVASFSVDGFIKGNAARKKITINFPTNTPVGGPFQLPLTQLVSGQRVIVFLQGNPDGAELNLFLPTNFSPTIIPIGQADVVGNNNQLSDKPLRQVLNILQLALPKGSKYVQIACLQRIGECGFLLYKPVAFKPVTSYSDAVANLRRSLNEPDSDLERFVEDGVAPSVYQLTQSPDGDVSLAAILTSASLQLPDVVPALRQLAHNNVKARMAALSALRGYANPKALNSLVVLLNDDDPQIRDAAAFSLRQINSPIALPFLVDSLKFGNENTYNVFAALNEISRARMLPDVASFEEKKSEFTKLWSDWGIDHKVQIEALRAGTTATFITPKIGIKKQVLVQSQSAPSFVAPDTNGILQSLADLKGKKNLLLTFFPKCFTGGCTNHLSSLRDVYPALQAADTEVWAVSVDPADGEHGQKAFAKQWNFQFPLIPDIDRKLSLLYGAVEQPTNVDQRISVLIDKQGVVRWIDTDVHVLTHGADVLAKIKELGLNR